MSKGRAGAFSTLTAIILLAYPANSQSVISTRSGLIHYFEGSVYLGDQPLESRPGKFPCVLPGGELRTERGEAEVLLTPGVFLRIGGQTAIRLVNSDLANTQVELLNGSAIVDSGEPNSGTSVTLIYKDWRVHFLHKGLYRIDSDPPRVSVREGEAEVFAGPAGQRVSVATGMSLAFADVLKPERSSDEVADRLSDWSTGRAQSIAADDAITAQIDEDPASTASDMDSFTYFPFLGVPSLGVGSYSLYSPYSSFTTVQPGFYSIYLPGYTYAPLLFGPVGRGFRSSWPTLPRIGGSPGIGTGFRGPGAGTTIPGPRPPVFRPAPVRPAPPAGARGGFHR